MTFLTKDQKPDTTFLGIKVEGNYGGWSRAIQEPIENLSPYFKTAFDDYGVKAVMWEQYTPGFNDGDPCEFGVRDPKVTTNAIVAEAWLDGTTPDLEEAYPDEDYSSDAYDEYMYEQWSDHPDGKHVNDISVPVDAAEYEDALRSKFGNNIKVIVTPNRVVTEEYDCGY